MLPAIESAIPTSGDVRASAGPLASTRRLRESSVARSGGTLRRASRSPRRSSGKTSRGSHSTRSSLTGTSSSPAWRPNTFVSTTTGTTQSPSRSPLGSSTVRPV
jgi:hypothetical protein